MISYVVRGRSLKTRITLATLVIFLASLWALSHYASQMLREEFGRILGEQQFSTVTLLAADIDKEFGNRYHALTVNAAKLDSTMLGNPAELQAFFERLPIIQSLFNGGVTVLSVDGTVIADIPASGGRIGASYVDRDEVVAALKEGRATIGIPPLPKRLVTPEIAMAVPIRDFQGKIIGVLRGATNPGSVNFLNAITDYRYGKTGAYLLIAPEQRLVVADTDMRHVMEPLPAPGINPLVDRFIEGYEGTQVAVNPMGVEVLSSTKRIPASGWHLAAALPTEEAFAPIYEMERNMLLATILLTVLAAGLTWWWLRREFAPMLAAVDALATLSGTTPPLNPLPIVRQDEIGVLIAGFNGLLKSLVHRETALRESEERFKALHDASFGGIAIHENGKILDCNQGLSDLTGWTIQELVGMDGFTLVTPESRDMVMRHIASGREQSYDAEGLRRDGTRYPLSVQGKNIPYKGRTVRVTEFRDITERKRAVEALRNSEENLTITLQSIGDAVIATDASGRVTRMNPTAERLTGWLLEDAYGRALTDVFHIVNADTREAVVDPVRRVMAHGQIVELANHTLLLAKSGEEYQIADNAAPIRSSSGEIVGVVLVFSDVTENYRIHKALHESEAILQVAMDQTPAGIAIVDAPDGALRYLNDAGLSIRGEDRASVVYGIGVQQFFNKHVYFDLDGRPLELDEVPLARAILFGETCAREFRVRRPDNSERIVVARAAPIRNELGEVVAGISVFLDITEGKMAEDRIKHLAFYDQLTGLPNRQLLIDRLTQALATRSRHRREGALLFIDLDNFKTLNDTLGHDVGDLLLQQVSQRLVACVREGDTVARIGGDEFVVMLENLSEDTDDAAAQTEAVGEKILAALNQIYHIGNYAHNSTASIGVTLFADSHKVVEDLLKRADLAMYQAKSAGRNTLRFFDPKMQAAVTARAAMDVDLREAIEQQQFFLHYQPQVNSSGRTVGAEALLRWQHPQRGLISPAEFIPIAEETGLILPIGQWVLETVCKQLTFWDARPEMAHLTVAVNVSARQFHHPDFVNQVLAALENSQTNPYRLKLELTESLLVHDVEDVIAKITALKAKGVGFSLDDFGTGYSSLAYLKRLPLDQLKIDQSFVQDVLTDSNDATIARTIIALGQSLGLSVIAEGVETKGQCDFLKRNGCHDYQGYLFSRPLPPKDFEAFSVHLKSI